MLSFCQLLNHCGIAICLGLVLVEWNLGFLNLLGIGWVPDIPGLCSTVLFDATEGGPISFQCL
jgi:hypothetical protein